MKTVKAKVEAWLWAIGALLTLVSFYGLISTFFFGSEPISYATDATSKSESGWVRLDRDRMIWEEDQGFHFSQASGRSSLIKVGDTLIFSDTSINLRNKYFTPLYWLPWVGSPKKIGIINNKECVVVEDMRLVGKTWYWMFVTKEKCPENVNT